MEGISKIVFQLQNNGLTNCNIYVARPEIYSTIEFEALVAYASKAASISESDMIVTLEALKDAFSYYLCNGHSFKIDGVGTFSLSLKSNSGNLTDLNPVEGADAVTALGINFLPDKALKVMINQMSLSTETANPNNLVEMTTLMLTSLKIGKCYSNLLQPNPAVAMYAAQNAIFELGGYNLHDGITVDLEGKKGEEDVSETIVLRGATKACNRLKGRISKSYDLIHSIDIHDGEDLIGSYGFTGNPNVANVMAYYGENAITEGSAFAVGGQLSIRGNVADCAVALDGVVLTPVAVGSNKLIFDVAITAGTHYISLNGTTYNFVISEVAVANVVNLTANGVTAANGSTSPVRKGQSYQFVATGQNLDKVTGVNVPAGMTTTGLTIGKNQITFTLVVSSSAQAGDIVIGNYICHLTIGDTSTSATITSGKPVADGGRYNYATGARVELHGTNMQDCKVTVNGADVSLNLSSIDRIQFDIKAAGNYVVYSDASKTESIYRFEAYYENNDDEDLEGPVV